MSEKNVRAKKSVTPRSAFETALEGILRDYTLDEDARAEIIKDISKVAEVMRATTPAKSAEEPLKVEWGIEYPVTDPHGHKRVGRTSAGDSLNYAEELLEDWVVGVRNGFTYGEAVLVTRNVGAWRRAEASK